MAAICASGLQCIGRRWRRSNELSCATGRVVDTRVPKQQAATETSLAGGGITPRPASDETIDGPLEPVPVVRKSSRLARDRVKREQLKAEALHDSELKSKLGADSEITAGTCGIATVFDQARIGWLVAQMPGCCQTDELLRFVRC